MRYGAKKLAMLVVTMLAVSFLSFAAFQVVQGDPATNLLGTEATPQAVAELRHELGLDRALIVRYGAWAAGLFTGDLGQSYSGVPVADLLRVRLPVTLVLSLTAFVMTLGFAIPISLGSVRQVRGAGRSVLLIVNQFLMALPPFFTGILLTWLFGFLLHWFRHGAFPGFSADVGGSVWYLVFPAVSIALPRIAQSVRMLRGTLLSEMDKDYVRTALSRGNDRGGVLYRHVLKNSLVPTVTFLAQMMAEIVAGSIVAEQVFNLPGLGRLLLTSIGSRDYPTVQAIVVILALWVVLANTAADLINRLVDPRLGGRT
jgi:peptide/nickel transport system permease protein